MNQLRKLLASLTLRQRITIGAAALAVAGGLYLLARWNEERNFRPLFTSLGAEDAGSVVQKLRETGVSYRIDETGGTVRIPAEKVAEVRLQMASAGLPKTGRIGFELFDKTNFGITDFTEQVNYRRALEGELERSVRSLSEVDEARVHVSLPKDSVFLESRQEGKASVMVRLKPRARLSTAQVAAICHLVSSAVDRLSPDSVSVLDMDGNLLARPRKAGFDDAGGAPDAALDYRQKLEKDLVAKINSALEPLLGTEKFRAGASVECDFTRGEQSEEIYDPARTVMLTSQKSEDVSGYGGGGGVPGTASNLPRPAPRGSSGGGGVTRRSENISYQSSKTVRTTRAAQGVVKHVSLAVLLDQDLRWEGVGAKARRVLTPPPPETVKIVRDLVAAATGLSTERGDQLIVESLPFEATLRVAPPEGPPPAAAPRPSPWPKPLQKYLDRMNPALLIGIGIGILVVVLGLPVLLLLGRRKKKAVVVEGPAQLAAGQEAAHGPDAATQMEGQLASHAAQQKKLDEDAMASLRLPPPQTKKGEVLAKHLRESAQKDPILVAQLVRAWLNEESR